MTDIIIINALQGFLETMLSSKNTKNKIFEYTKRQTLQKNLSDIKQEHKQARKKIILILTKTV